MTLKTTPTPIRFGTDGWRAVIAEGFTFANLARVAQAYANYLTTNSVAPLVIVGYDRRFLCEEFAERAAEVLRGNSLRVAMFDKAVPTPLVTWTVKESGAAGGIVITASHNPPEFNGFKIKAPWGGSASPETTLAVESFIDTQPPRRSRNATSDEREMLQTAIDSYRSQIASYIDLERLRRSRLKIIVDPMHGSGGRWVESFLQGRDLQTETIRADRDPLFGGAVPPKGTGRPAGWCCAERWVRAQAGAVIGPNGWRRCGAAADAAPVRRASLSGEQEEANGSVGDVLGHLLGGQDRVAA